MIPPIKILVVDDDEAIRAVIGLILSSEGYEVTFASDGIEAIEHTSSTHFHLVLMDLMMKDMDGIETILALRASHQDTRIIAMSGGWDSGNRSYLALAKTIGADQTLCKPFNKSALLDAISKEMKSTRSHPTMA